MSVNVAPLPWDMVRRASWAIRWMPGERNSCSAVKRATDCGPGTVDTLATAFFCWVIPLPLKVIRYMIMAPSAIIGRRREERGVEDTSGRWPRLYSRGERATTVATIRREGAPLPQQA